MKNCKLGVSLIEISLAVLIFALAIIPIYHSLKFGASTEIETEKVALANKILESFREEILGMPFSVLETDFPSTDWQPIGANYPDVFKTLFEAQKKFKDFEFTGKAKQISTSVIPTMEFSAQVTWTSAKGNKFKPVEIFFIKVKK